MKLSELSTDRALDTLCELTPYISNVVSDESVLSIVGKVIDFGEDMNLYGKGLMLVERIGEIVPVLLKAHRDDLYNILSVMNERPASEIAGQKLMETMRQVRELLQDEEFLSFFKSSAQQAQSKPSAPSAESPASE